MKKKAKKSPAPRPVLAWCALYDGKIVAGWTAGDRKLGREWARETGGKLIRVEIRPAPQRQQWIDAWAYVTDRDDLNITTRRDRAKEWDEMFAERGEPATTRVRILCDTPEAEAMADDLRRFTAQKRKGARRKGAK